LCTWETIGIKRAIAEESVAKSVKRKMRISSIWDLSAEPQTLISRF